MKSKSAKTQVYAFHLRTKEAKRIVNITWRESVLEHTPNSNYLEVVLYRSLIYGHNSIKRRQKFTSRNNLLHKLTGSVWSANKLVLKSPAEALCFSTGEYACPVSCQRRRHCPKWNVYNNCVPWKVYYCLIQIQYTLPLW